MAIYSGFLRIVIHLLAVLWIIVSTLIGMAIGTGATAEYGVVTITGPMVTAIIGFIAGLFFVAFFFGIIALLFEIRDSLVAIKETQVRLGARTAQPRVEPSLSASN